MKQSITTTSSYHVEFIAIHEASRGYVWLRSLINYIQESCDLSSENEIPTVLHEDNATCIIQLKGGYQARYD